MRDAAVSLAWTIIIGGMLLMVASVLAGCGACPGHLTCRMN